MFFDFPQTNTVILFFFKQTAMTKYEWAELFAPLSERAGHGTPPKCHQTQN